MEELLELTRYRQTTIQGDRTTHKRYQGQHETWIKGRELGSGAFGSVWLEEEESGSRMLLAELHYSLADRAEELRAVKRVGVRNTSLDCRKEIVALAKLRRFEEFFVYFHGWYEDRDAIYLAMDYFPLGDLSRYLAKRIAEGQVQNMTRQLLSGLGAMHSIGFCHRDLKPLNIFVVKGPPDWKVKIGDFGIAKRAHGDDTVLKTTVGTPAYMAPEMFPYLINDNESHPYTEAVDIWALGSVVYQLHALRPPFGTHNPISRFVRGETSFPRADLRSAEISASGVEFLEVLLKPLSDDRPTAAEALNHPWLAEVNAAPLPSVRDGSQAGLDTDAWGSEASARWTTEDFESPTADTDHSIASGNGSSVADAAPYYVKATGLEFHSKSVETRQDSSIVKRLVPVSDESSGGSLTATNSDQHVSSASVLATHQKPSRETNLHTLFNPDSAPISERATPHFRKKHVPMTIQTTMAPTSLDTTVKACQVKQFQVHRAAVWRVAFSSDRRQVALVSCDKTVRLWDIVTGAEVKRLEGHKDAIWGVAFSPDGRQVASASCDETVRLWDIVTGAEVKRFEGHGDAFWGVAFSPDGQQVASASTDRTVRLWDAVTGTEVKRFKGHEEMVFGLAFSPNGRLVASASGDRTVRLWDTVTGAEFKRFKGHEGLVFMVAFSPDRRLVASSSADWTVRLWDTVTGAEVKRLKGHEGLVFMVAFSPDRRLVASSSVDMTVRLWDAVSGAEVKRLEGYEDGVWDVAFSPDGRQVTLASGDTTVEIWDVDIPANVISTKEDIDVQRNVMSTKRDGSFARRLRNKFPLG